MIEVVTRPAIKDLVAGAIPDAIFLHLKLELAKSKMKNAKPLILDTLVVPIFANLKLQKKFCSDLLPKALDGL